MIVSAEPPARPARTFPVVVTRLAVALVVALLGAAPAGAVDRSRPPPLAPPAPFALPAAKLLPLRSGAQLWFVERHRAPLVDVVAVARGGALVDAAGREGTAASLAAMLTQGAGDRDAFAFSDATARLGARLEVDATWTSTDTTLHVASARFADALPLLADVLLRPRLTADDWQRKQAEALGELAYLRDEPRALAQLAAAKAQFPTDRQGRPLGGTGVSVGAITVDDLRAAHARQFRPDNVFFVVVGDIDAARLVALFDGAFAGWTAPSSTTALPRPVEPQAPAGVDVILVDRPGAPQSVLQVRAALPVDLPPFDPAAAVMQTLLGGSFTSRLNNNLREEHGYSYGAFYGVSVWPTHTSTVSTSVATPVTGPALTEILHELARIRAPATTDEVERARAYEALNFPSVLDGGAALAGSIAAWKEQGIADDVIAGYIGRVLAVDVAAVQGIGARLVDPTHLTVVVVGDAAAVRPDLAKLGRVRTMTVDDLLPMPKSPAPSSSPSPSGP
jgi:predicted Zn-dependent peptidase